MASPHGFISSHSTTRRVGFALNFPPRSGSFGEVMLALNGELEPEEKTPGSPESPELDDFTNEDDKTEDELGIRRKSEVEEEEQSLDKLSPLKIIQSQFLNNRSSSFKEDGEAYSKRLGPKLTRKDSQGQFIKYDNIIPRARTLQDQKDAFCDPDKPRLLHFQDVGAAAYKLRGGIERTPCTKSNRLSTILDMQLYFKKEFLQITGSFKERGARYTLIQLPAEQKKLGVVAASAGNHALALSYHGIQLGIPVTVVMPLVAPLMKISLCRTYGANVMVQGSDIGKSKDIAMKIAQDEGLMYINGYDHPDILAGQGTIGLEILEQVPDVDAVVVPVGGAGLIAGISLAIKYLYPSVRIIGVEAQSCPSFTKALEAGKPVYTKPGSTLSDGLSVPVVGVNAFVTAKDLVDKMVLVSEEDIARAILHLIELEKAVVEGAGAVGFAALLAGHLPELKGKKVVVPLCGGNIDTTVLGRCLDRGLAAEGRLCRFVVTVSDRPGGIAELTSLLASHGVSIKDIFHERAWIKSDIFSVRVKGVVETRDWDHADELEELLNRHYTDVIFNDKAD